MPPLRHITSVNEISVRLTLTEKLRERYKVKVLLGYKVKVLLEDLGLFGLLERLGHR